MFRDENLPRHRPHHDLQAFPGQIAALPAVGPAAVLGPGEAPGRTRPLLQGGDPALQEVPEHMQRGEAALRQRPDLAQHGVELRRQGWLGPPGLAVIGGSPGRHDEALVGFGGGNYPLLAPLKASRPLIRVLVINDNGLWINDFI